MQHEQPRQLWQHVYGRLGAAYRATEGGSVTVYMERMLRREAVGEEMAGGDYLRRIGLSISVFVNVSLEEKIYAGIYKQCPAKQENSNLSLAFCSAFFSNRGCVLSYGHR